MNELVEAINGINTTMQGWAVWALFLVIAHAWLRKGE